MAFCTITLAPGLSAQDHRRAARAGPPAVSSRSDSTALARRAGFERVSATDVTAHYLDTARAWVEARDRHRAELENRDRPTFLREQRNERAAVAATEAGWLRRQLVTAVRPI